MGIRRFAEDAAGVTGGDAVGRDVMDNDTSRPDDRIVTDCDAGKDLDSCAEPNIAADRNRLVESQPLIPLVGINRVTGGMEAAGWTDKDMIPENHLASVEDDRPVIGKKVFSDLDIIAVITPERRIDETALPYLSK